MRILGATRWPTLLAAGVLVALVLAVFFPIVGFDFVDYDVRKQVLDNRYVQSLSGENLKHILTSRCVTSYYPVRTLTFAADCRLWGLDPAGFKRTNCLIHLANVLLVYWLALRLFRHPAAGDGSSDTRRDVCVAAFSAGLFAVHPVVVEPVTWVAGREELLMLLGALGCVHFHVTARRLDEQDAKRRWAMACYVSAALCCLAACLSNAVAAVIPLLIVAWDVLMLTGPKFWRIVRGTSVLWLMSAVTIAIKKPGFGGNSLPGEVGALSAQRLALVLNVYWLNLKSLVYPTSLAVRYSDATPEGLLDVGPILGLIAVGLTCAILWGCRRRELILYGLVWFVLALGPTSQIMPHHIHRADRFLYLPLAGLVVALATGLRLLVCRMKGRCQPAGPFAVSVLVFCLLVALSAAQVQTWRNSLLMWENCLRVDPDIALAQGGLADNLAKIGRFDQAIRHYRIALRLDPNDTQTLKNFATLLATCQKEELRDYDEAICLAKRACQLAKSPDPAAVMVLAEIHAQAGQSELVVPLTQKAIEMAAAAGDTETADQLRRRLNLYQEGAADSSP